MTAAEDQYDENQKHKKKLIVLTSGLVLPTLGHFAQCSEGVQIGLQVKWRRSEPRDQSWGPLLLRKTIKAFPACQESNTVTPKLQGLVPGGAWIHANRPTKHTNTHMRVSCEQSTTLNIYKGQKI